MSTLRLNMSDEEAASTARTYEVVPTGAYLCNIVEIKEQKVSQGKNIGEPYWNIHFVVDDGNGKYAGSHIYSNVMLFQGALYAAKQLVESVFPENIDGNTIDIPEPEAFYGKQVVVTGLKHNEGSDIKKKGKVVGTYDRDTFEVKGFKPANTANKPKGETSLLP